MATYNPKRFVVCVVKLGLAALAHRKFRDDNSNYQSGKNCYYVGKTSSTPQERYKQHKAGYEACRFAKTYGVELMLARLKQINPRTYEKTSRHERPVAKRLKNEGYGVCQR